MSILFNDLNEQQRCVVECTEGPVVVFAGAGTGKTRVITYRIAYLLTKGVKPENILAVTFTNKAADEMKSRVIDLITNKLNLKPNISTKEFLYSRIWISTFHSFCAHFLRCEAEVIGVKKNFVIYDEDDQKKVVKECMKELLVSERELDINFVISQINRAKDNLIDSESYKINTFVFNDPYREIVGEIYSKYQKKLEQNSAFDFSDLIMKTVVSLKTIPELKEKYSERYKYIHVDEYQDINYAQAVLLKLLASKYKNICVVGDDDQAIYSWRGGNVNYLLNFKKEFPEAKEFKLEHNYRSTKIILQLSNTLISNNKFRAKKVLWTQNENCSINDIKILQFKTEYEEAKFVAKEIKKYYKEYKKENKSLNDIAVFYRSNAQSRVFEEIFQLEGIPYKIVGAVGFYEREEIKDILAYLRILVNPYDTVSLKRVINVPARGISDTTVLYLETLAKETSSTLWDQLIKIDNLDLSLRTKNAVWKFLSLYDMLKKYKDTMFPSEFIEFLIEKTGYLKMLQTSSDPRSLDRIENIKELISAAKNYELQERYNNPVPEETVSIENFLSTISLTTKLETEITKSVSKEDTGCVSIMTLHSSKGLEFDIVFITGLEEKVFPVWWAIKGYNRDMFYAQEYNLEDFIEEERRLCYVGITRAKRKVYLTYSQTRRLWGVETQLSPSRFIDEIMSFYESYEVEKENSEDTDKPIKIENLKLGEYVYHKKFGIGKVVDILRDSQNGDKIVVVFNDGEKRKLYLKYAPLRKI